MVDNIHSLCPPAIIYLVFSFTQIIIDMFKGLYNTSFFKFIVMMCFTLLLNVLCKEGLSIISWIIVFIPFMMMSIVTAILLFVFGLDPATGKLHYKDLTQRYKYPDKDIQGRQLDGDSQGRHSDWDSQGRQPDGDRRADSQGRHSDWSDRRADSPGRQPDWDSNDDTDDRYNTDINDTNFN